MDNPDLAPSSSTDSAALAPSASTASTDSRAGSSGLKAHIRQISLFGTTVGFDTDDDPPFAGYFGEQIYIRSATFDTSSRELLIRLDTLGPTNAVLPSVPAPQTGQTNATVRATLAITPGSTPKSSVSMPLPTGFPANGGGLVASATMTFDDDLTRLVTPSVDLLVPPARDLEFLAYVAITLDGTSFLRWIDAPLIRASDKVKRTTVIPPDPGNGVVGPWGLGGS